jgi:hypothetical protein
VTVRGERPDHGSNLGYEEASRPRRRGLTVGQPQSDAIDRWIAGCTDSWVPMPPFAAAVAEGDGILADRRPLLHVWCPGDGEDQWLQRHLGQRVDDTVGAAYVEVPVGGAVRYGRGARTRFIDAVRFPDAAPRGIVYSNRATFAAACPDNQPRSSRSRRPQPHGHRPAHRRTPPPRRGVARARALAARRAVHTIRSGPGGDLRRVRIDVEIVDPRLRPA